jgi:hypothetical protein
MLPAGNLDEVELSVQPHPGYRPEHRQCIIPQVVTKSSAPEDGRYYRPKHVELIGIINKPLLLHLVGCLYYFISDARSSKYQIFKRQRLSRRRT